MSRESMLGDSSDFDRGPGRDPAVLAFRVCFVSSSSGIGRNGCPRNSGQATASLSIHPGKAEDPVSDEPHQFLTSGELDVNDLFSTKLQEGACTAHLRGVFTNTGEVEITHVKEE